jgi:predicted SAM-dependent methyltransferase
MSENDQVRLHLGCGEVYLEGFINIDFPPESHTVQISSQADEFADITNLTYPEESVSEIRLHHVFEHFNRATATRLLIQWYLWLEDEGQLILETPDFEKCVRKMYSPLTSIRKRSVIMRHIFGSQEAHWAIHQDGWDKKKYEVTLTSLGYKILHVKRSSWKSTYNITVVAAKQSPFRSKQQLIEAGKDLLRTNLVDYSESESRLYSVWVKELDQISVDGHVVDEHTP